MLKRDYCIVDIETSGKGIHNNRITEICVVRLHHDKVVDKFTSLVNPETSIPMFITGLTGIHNEMVSGAPLFSEIADRIEEITKDAVFVAHNVNFDYSIIRSEFKRVGMDFTRKKLCTVRLSRKLIPGLFSYSLGRLCSSLSIHLENRHRAEGDADATTVLFQRILSLDTDLETINSFIHARSKEATLPPHLSKAELEALPSSCGIYIFRNREDKIIYVGKAKNIKNRVLSHFYDKRNNEYDLGQETFTIDYEETGNELIALLLESEKIHMHYPKFNRAQKKAVTPYRIISYENREGIIQLAIQKTNSKTGSLDIHYQFDKAISRLEEICIDFDLCPRFCHLQQTQGSCSHYKISNCGGVCTGKISVKEYNSRVLNAIYSFSTVQKTYLIKEKGRYTDEDAFVFVEDGVYKGFGFIPKNEQLQHIEDLEPFLNLKKETYHASKILNSYLSRSAANNIITEL